MVQTRRERLREANAEEIKALARHQMREQGGAAAISLRGIAQQMGLSVGALYRYYASRDDLLTALIVEAYSSLGDATNAAGADHAADDYAGRFEAAALAYRTWALDNPAEFDLIFGQPVPGYHAPDDPTARLVQRAFAPFIATVYSAWQAGQVTLPAPYAAAPSSLLTGLAGWLPTTDAGFLPVLHFSLAKWGLMHGIIALELNGQFGPLPPDTIAALYAFEIRAMLHSIGLPQKE